MPLVYASVMPHGGLLIPGLEEGPDCAELTAAMQSLALRGKDADLDALVIATPHGVRLDEAHSIGFSDETAGSVGKLSLSAPIHRELGWDLIQAASAAGVEVVGVAPGDPAEPFPMDWGVMIPAWFFAEIDALPPIVPVCPTRALGLESLASFGEALAVAAESSPLRIGIIASADGAHAHLEDGPYGFHPTAKIFDARIVELTKAGDFEDYLALEEDLIESALPDSPWQLAILTGAFRKVPFRTAEVVYGCPTYFGMMCAGFDRDD